MTPQELFRLWAPDEALWSRWAKPVAFLGTIDDDGVPARPAPEGAPAEVVAVPGPDAGIAVVVNLPGAASVATGVALAQRGFRPVPLFNGVADPNGCIDVQVVRRALQAHAPTIAALPLLPAAPPAFLLDKFRLAGGGPPPPGMFDNRWLVLPQDLPSGAFLAGNGIRRAVLLDGPGWLDDDLGHVLRRWQEAGLRLERLDPASPPPVPLDVPRPSRFRSLWYRAAAALGLRPNSAGGFGASVPRPSQSGGWGGGFG
ncbi:MAG: hypothetical protein HY905_00450 [Deltaproteobacteria bacterium]|nr:hypothetical protein [Deltaproteobacteria bacterium]